MDLRQEELSVRRSYAGSAWISGKKNYLSGGLMRVGTEGPHGTGGAFGFSGCADFTAEEDQPQREITPFLLGNDPHEVGFDPRGDQVPGQSEPAGDAPTACAIGLSEMLTVEGFQVLTAANGCWALQIMHTTTPDLILSHITMPEMDGYTFLKAVRERQEWVMIPVIFLTAREEKTDILTSKQLGVEDYLIKPLSREELVMAIRYRLLRAHQLQMAHLQQAYDASLSALANAIDLRDAYTGGHVERVTNYSLTLAKLLGWSEQKIENLRFGAILHDIGKIHIGESTLLKPGRLDEDEWREIYNHPITGAEMIRDIPYLSGAIEVIRHHHERWDGLGYPNGLVGEQIPPEARIVAVADSFDAMTTERPYGPARSLHEPYQEILDCSGKQYDPQIVAVFKRAWELHFRNNNR